MKPEVMCSVSSLAAEEPLAGTAVAGRWRWLGLEYRPAWAARGVEEAVLPPEARAFVDAFAARPGHRVQLLRRPHHKSGPLTVQLADSRVGALREGTIDSYEELPALELDALPTKAGPVLWVCTHGQRDFCCGTHGGRVFAEAHRMLGDDAWQTSHLGGHRFAPTLLAWPQGVCYGRLAPRDVGPLLDALREGRLYRHDTVRGRVAWSRGAQAAEAVLRGADDALGADEVALVVDTPERVILRARGREHGFSIETTPLDEPVVASCGKSPGPAWSVVARPA